MNDPRKREYKVTIIPAEPGWYIVDKVTDDNKNVVELITVGIVAWHCETWIDKDEYVKSLCTPLTVESVPDNYAILQPDGKVVFPEDQIFDSLSDALKYLQEKTMPPVPRSVQ